MSGMAFGARGEMLADTAGLRERHGRAAIASWQS
jgi:hypothetical protein